MPLRKASLTFPNPLHHPRTLDLDLSCPGSQRPPPPRGTNLGQLPPPPMTLMIIHYLMCFQAPIPYALMQMEFCTLLPDDGKITWLTMYVLYCGFVHMMQL